MSGELEVVPMRLLDRGFELGAREMHVGLEGVDTLARPIGDFAPGILRRADLVTLDEESARTFEIRTCHIEMRSNQMAGIDLMLQAEVGIGFDAAGRAHRRPAVGEIE